MATVSPVVTDYIKHAGQWLTPEQLRDHTGAHPWTIQAALKKAAIEAPTKPGLTHAQAQAILLATDSGVTHMRVKNTTIAQLSAAYNAEPCLVRQLLNEHRRITPDSFEIITNGGGRVRGIPTLMRFYIKECYTKRTMSSRGIAQHLEADFGIFLTDFGIRKVLEHINVPRRDKAKATLLAVNKLTDDQEHWIANVYRSADSMNIPLVQEAFQNKFGTPISSNTVRRILDSHSIAIRGARKDTTQRDRKHREKLLRTIQPGERPRVRV